MHAISNEELAVEVDNAILRDVLEWPLRVNEQNQARFSHMGAKGGSTLFILNEALYTEQPDGTKEELIIFTEGFSTLERRRMQAGLNEFSSEILYNETFRKEVKETLQDEE
ncbi:hypothetical protein [Salsuginibacillus kocurii]|uniref:hypothetical protein n=1 Tax=Salsuginibacillus kocurii TaxID=427078 RepID=UPI000363B24E|nr:hypothetical protein [Salsuginibacillus kocurii]